ncbi:MAG: pullulanase-type alpha-1,6-glucosidase [Halothece sp.]
MSQILSKVTGRGPKASSWKKLILYSIIAFFLVWTQPACADSNSPLNWVGNMFPSGNSNIILPKGESFSVYTQVYKKGVTPSYRQGGNISCTLYWGEVKRFGGNWQTVTTTPMSYIGDTNENDEYRAMISPDTGLYEYTTRCIEEDTETVRWQSGGNGRLTVSPVPNAPEQRKALWIDHDTIAWNQSEGVTYELHYAPSGNVRVPVRSGEGITLREKGKLLWDEYPKFPNIGGYDGWQIPSAAKPLVPAILKSESAIAAYDENGKLIDATGLQLQGVLDDLYSYSGDLGVIYDRGTPTLKLWAPTAKSVTLHRYENTYPNIQSNTHEMNFNPETGVWTVVGDRSWDRQYYLYEVEVYVPFTGKFEKTFVSDPYSVNLSQDSRFSQMVDLYEDPSLKPEGWDEISKSPLTAPEDMAIYEVHVRDFSRNDAKVPERDRGTFNAFTYNGKNGKPLSNGMSHLNDLAEAGLTHIHLLPASDFASVEENPEARINPNPDILASFARDSVQQQAIIGSTRGNDSFNWGYDPYHYGVPEGSYATAQDDATRILEFRKMVQALNESNLKVVMDMVYNHTFANGLYTQAVLDKVVPGYYHRYNNEGYQVNSSCCADTATEFDMMEKLMVDTIQRWIKAYKVDGFRFDLMNLHTVDNMVKLRDTIRRMTPAQDGVDGNNIYLYGEGWDFGSAKDKGLHHASQYNMAGTGIGTFNDKIRDAVHGGYSTNPQEIHRQGFINGQSYDWNGYFYNDRFRNNLRKTTDKLRINLAGSLQDFHILNQNNQEVSGLELDGTGYVKDPQESVNYISKHDNETLFDLNLFKMPLGQSGSAVTSMNERVRAQNLGLSLVGFSQGVPFFHLGSDMLRSKSLDHNSYDSGDWFNRVDFTYTKSNFGVGLPPAWNNQERWEIMAPLLRNSKFDPTQEHILDNVSHFQDVLKIRRSSPLFRLRTKEEIEKRVQFHNMGENQKDGFIAMSISDTVGENLDSNYDQIAVFFNADKFRKKITIPEFAGSKMMLHPVQTNSRDDVVKTAKFDLETGQFEIPPRTAAVFVTPE